MHEGISVKNATFNTFWIVIEKVLRIGIAFFVTPMVTNYLGLTDYGQYTYVTTYYNLFIVFVDLGLGNAIVKEFIKHKDNPRVHGSLYILRLFGSIISSLSMFLVYVVVGEEDTSLLILMGIASLKFIFISLGSIDLYLQSISKFKTISIIRNIAYLMITVMQIVFVLLKLPLMYFMISFSIEILLVEIGMFITYKNQGGQIQKWEIDWKYLVSILKDYYPIIITAFASTVSLRISQILIGEMINKESLGIYSIAIKLTEIWYFAISSVNAVLVPILLGKKENNDKKYKSYMQRMFDLMTWVGLGVVLLVIVSTQILLYLLYDPVYWDAGKYVLIYSLNMLTSAQAVATSVWYLSENLQKFSMRISIAGMLLSFFLNYILIRLFGVYGAASATILSSLFILWILPLFSKKTRPIVFMLLKSLNLFNIYRDIRQIIKQNKIS